MDNSKIKFKKIPAGKQFEFDNVAYLKLKSKSNLSFNCVELATGVLVVAHLDLVVIPIEKTVDVLLRDVCPECGMIHEPKQNSLCSK